MSIEINGVTVDLPIYSVKSRSFRRTVTSSIGGRLYRRKDDVVSVRALNNISLKIGDHERVGIIGPNGAGKSTLLKVLAGVYTPTTGSVSVRGTISAALNTSLGLDTELSGRENIYLLGYYRRIKRAVIDAHVQEIVESTELGDFIDLPMHTYSAGMLGRITFAVATAFEPEVLLMDEWLMAGDMQFMNKAAERVNSFVSKARVVVLASHSLATIQSLCSKALYLRNGELIAYGPVDEVVAQYERDDKPAPGAALDPADA